MYKNLCKTGLCKTGLKILTILQQILLLDVDCHDRACNCGGSGKRRCCSNEGQILWHILCADALEVYLYRRDLAVRSTIGRETCKHLGGKIRVRAETLVIVNRNAVGNKTHPGVEAARKDRWA